MLLLQSGIGRAVAHALRILHLSTVDIEGGAARSAYRLHLGLRQLGDESLMLVAEKKSYDPSVIAFAPRRAF